MFADIQSGYAATTGLLPDFIVNLDSTPEPAEPNFFEGDYDGEYSYNACRTPWRISLDYLVNGNTSAMAVVSRQSVWIDSNTGSDASKIVDGYWLDGSSIGDWNSPAFVGPFGVGAMVAGSPSGWSTEVYYTLAAANTDSYFEDTLKLLSLIAISGNWWAPEQIFCQ
jgi:hypothetical protein